MHAYYTNDQLTRKVIITLNYGSDYNIIQIDID